MKALIGMSGGVDSSVAVHLTMQAGFDCIGGTMLLHDSTPEAALDAAAVAERMGIPFRVFDLSSLFREKVMDAFVSCYEQGLTPNPCVVCNRYLKFGAFLDIAREMGCDYVVTGHYARIEERDGRFLLKKAADEAKDQTYFLYTLTQEQLKHTLFPLGSLTKTEARAIAEALGLLNAKKRDSQDICFIPDGDYMVFMERHTNKTYEGGNYLDLQGNVVGQHRGAVAYTLGQRKGLGLAMGAPVYVCGKDMATNTVTVGPNEALFHSALRANDWNWIAMEDLKEPVRVTAKARSRMQEEPATVYPEENGFARVEFDEPQRAITPGQAVVLYDGDTVIGGGTITEVI
jgi:tRNA-specific 2-thiouridylase